MTEDEVICVLSEFDTASKAEKELRDLKKRCDKCGVPCAICNKCEVLCIKTVLQYRIRELRKNDHIS